MTVSSTTRKVGPFLGNGVATAFPFTFKVFTTSDITLTLTDTSGAATTLTLGSDYSIALNVDQDNNPGGTITYPLSGSPLAAGQTLTGLGSLAASQGTDLTSLGRFLPQVIENAFDKLTILMQQVLEKVGRTLVAPASESSIGALPTAANRASKFLAFDASGNPIAASGTGADAGLRADLATGGLGALLVAFLQSGIGAVVRLLASKVREIEVNTKDFGAAVDGASDDIAAWEAACAYVSGLGGGVVNMPMGISVISRILVVPANVRLRGRGKRGSTLKASGTFSTGTAVVRLGTTTAFAFDCRLEDIAVDCNDRAPVGITSAVAQEGSGARNVLVTRYTGTGIDLDDTAGTLYCDHFDFQDIELYCSGAAVGSTGFHYKGLKNGGQIRRLTVNPNLPAGTQGYGVRVEGTGAAGCHINIDGVNVESHGDAVFFDTNGGGIVKNVTLITAGTNVVHIATDKTVVVEYARKVFGTNTIKNDTISENITDVEVASYVQVAAAQGLQVFHANGRTGNLGSVTGTDNPVHTVKTLATSTGAQRCAYRLLDGNNDGWLIQFAGDGAGDPLRLFPIAGGVVGSSVFDVLDTGAIRSLATTNGPTGTLTLGAAATTQMNNTAVSGSSTRVFLQPSNAAAAALVKTKGDCYVSTKVANSHFIVSTGDGTAAAGTETFDYWLVN